MAVLGTIDELFREEAMNILKKRRSAAFAVSMACAVVAVLSCRLEVPIQEMSQAKVSLSRAVEVKSEKYAPDELKKSRELLVASHKSVSDEEMGDAKKNADLSYQEAQKAIAKALPLLAKDSLAESKKVYGEADNLYASMYASQSFGNAGKALQQAETLNTGKNYWESHLKSQEALRFSNEAKTASMARMPEVKAEIQRLNREADTLASKRGSEFAQADISTAKSRLSSADAKVGEKNLKSAHSLINEAKVALGGAATKTNRGISLEKLNAAKKTLGDVEASPMKQYKENEIKQAASLIQGSTSLHNGGSYPQSIAKSEQAIAMLSGISVALGQKESQIGEEAKNKLMLAENGLEKLNKSEMKDQYTNDIGKVQGLVGKSRNELERKSYRESIASSDEALTIINSVSVAMEKSSEAKKGEAEKGKDDSLQENVREVYIVKLNPRNRDCLWKIAWYTYRNASLWPLIYVANKDKIKDPDLIFPGQKLVIPVAPGKEGKSAEKAKKAEGGSTEANTLRQNQ